MKREDVQPLVDAIKDILNSDSIEHGLNATIRLSAALAAFTKTTEKA